MFNWFSRKKEVDQLKVDTKEGFEAVKKDISAVSGWIKHLDSERDLHKRELKDLRKILSSIHEEMEGLKNVVALMGEIKPNRAFKTPRPVFKKQTPVYPVQTDVQTDVQTPNLDQFSITERAILWVLLNSELKLSYEDIGAMLGKEKTTIRGQINTIKQKSEGIIEEIIEQNGKKRLYIPENIKQIVLKKSKVRVKQGKKVKKTQKISEY